MGGLEDVVSCMLIDGAEFEIVEDVVFEKLDHMVGRAEALVRNEAAELGFNPKDAVALLSGHGLFYGRTPSAGDEVFGSLHRFTFGLVVRNLFSSNGSFWLFRFAIWLVVGFFVAFSLRFEADSFSPRTTLMSTSVRSASSRADWVCFSIFLDAIVKERFAAVAARDERN